MTDERKPGDPIGADDCGIRIVRIPEGGNVFIPICIWDDQEGKRAQWLLTAAQAHQLAADLTHFADQIEGGESDG